MSRPRSRTPTGSRSRVDGEAEAVAAAVGENLLDVAADVAAHRGAGAEERVVLRGAAVAVEAEDHAGVVRRVGLGPAELVVRLAAAEGAVGQVLQMAAAAL